VNVRILMPFINFCTSVFYFYIYYIFFNKVLEKKNYKRFYFLLVYAVAIIANLLIRAFADVSYLIVVGAAVETLLLAFLLYQGKWLLKIFSALFLITLCELIEMITGTVLLLTTHSTVAMIMKYPAFQFEGSVFTDLLFFLIVILIIKFKRSKSGTIPNSLSALLMIIPVLSFIVLYLFFIMTDERSLTFPFVFSAVGVLCINIMVYAFFESLAKQSEIKLQYKLAQQQLSNQIRHYEQLIDNRKMMREMIHDLKNHIIAIDALATEGKVELAKEYIHTLKNEAGKILKTVDTGHPVIDAVLDEKKQFASEAGIEIDIKVMLPDNLGINNVDLCIILGNALDNAIEACRRINSDSIKKEISVKLSASNGYFVAVISNSACEAPGNFWEEYPTTKENKILHGYGLHNINKAVEKYDGNLQILHDGSNFILNIVMHMQTAV
jgi:two-component system sensor histidine kinase AgrC